MELFELMQTSVALFGLGILILGLQGLKAHLRRMIR